MTSSNGGNYWTELGTTPEQLMRAAEGYRTMAYAPYSKFLVGAALLMDDGSVIGGCNVENASYGISLCAERIAMGNAVSAGKRNPLAIAVAGTAASLCSPCGACRQFLAEFNPNIEVLLMKSGEIFPLRLEELLPYQFKLEDV